MTNAVKLAGLVTADSPIGSAVIANAVNTATMVHTTGKLNVGSSTFSWSNPIAAVGQNAGGIVVANNGVVVQRTTLPSSLSPSKTIYVSESNDTGSYSGSGQLCYTYGLPNGGPSGQTVDLFYISFNNGWHNAFCTVEIFQSYYLNSGYRRYTYTSGYQPTFSETAGSFGRNDISLTNTWIAQYNNNTTATPGTGVDSSYHKGICRVTIPSYWGGHVRVTTNHTPVQSMSNSYHIQFL
jgi:hypothetical protein